MSKARGTMVPSGQEVVNVGSTRISEGKPKAVAVPDSRAPPAVQDATDEAHQMNAVGVSIGQTEELHANGHSKIPSIADPDKTLSGGNNDIIERGAVKADYGVISLFDGVSTVVPALHEKIGYPPTVILLAEIDITFPALVCAEFGYRPDQNWGRTKHGSACLMTTVDACMKRSPLRQMLSGS